MSDLSIYELDDIIWDEFDRSDDHIVPHPSNVHPGEHSYQGDISKRPRREVIGVSNSACNVYGSNISSQETEERDTMTSGKKCNMLEKEKAPWSRSPSGSFAVYCEGGQGKEETTLASDDSRMSDQCLKKSNITSTASEFSAGDPMLRSTTVDSDSYDFSLTEDLSFLENDCEDKDSHDLLYYGWPDMGNFDDVDRMLRDCDSSFGLDITCNEDDLGWFSSEGPLEGHEEALKPDFNFPYSQSNAQKSLSEESECRKLNDQMDKCTSQITNCTSQITVEFKPKEQARKKQSKHQIQADEKRRGKLVESGSIYHVSDMENNDGHLSSADKSSQSLKTYSNQQQKQKIDPDSSCCLQNNISYSQAEYGHAPNLPTIGSKSYNIKSESNGTISLSGEGSYASTHMMSMGSLCEPSFHETTIKLDDEGEKVHRHHDFQPSFASNSKNVRMVLKASMSDSARGQKRTFSLKEVESRTDLERFRVGVPTELGSINVQESSSMSSGLDEIPFEATSFYKLQQVMEQLDLRTKLCIRDSLYRLARSAEQRHNYANTSSGCVEYRDADGVLMADGTNKCQGFMDMETDTNPIDRSVAHLLFHTPSDMSGMPAQNPLLTKSNSIVYGSSAGPPAMAAKLACNEEAAAESVAGD